MDFNINKEQKMYKDSARTFFKKEWSFDLLRENAKASGFSRKLWKKVADLGWLGLLVDEEYGGFGASFMDVCIIIEEMGRFLFPCPYLATAVVGASILSEEADDSIKKKLLPAIVNGDAIITYAFDGAHNGSKKGHQLKMNNQGDEFLLNGSAMFVPYVGISDYVICRALDDSGHGSSLFLVNLQDKGLSCERIPTFSVDMYYKLNFRDVRLSGERMVGDIGNGFKIIEKLMPKIVAACCVEMLGGLQRVLDITVQFVKERKQFGQPIGSFQTIQNYCADIAIDLEASRVIAYQAAWKISMGDSGRGEASMAKA
ncbi:MAG: Acyl-CoA dehydrogenase-like [bacterium]|nr:MAG: Acyl-CoA dehydrogenase-like [bacterium]